MLKSKFFQIVIIFCIVLTTGIAVFADTIRLKDGSVIKGRIVGFREGQFVVQIGDGSRSRQMTFFSDEIEAIEFDSANSVSAARGDSSPSVALPNRPNISSPSPTPAVSPNVGSSGSDVIVVGRKNTIPQTNPTPAPTPLATPVSTPTPIPIVPSRPSTTAANPAPIRLSLKVLADNTSNGWTNAGWVVRKGQKIRIISNGRISLGKGNYATPTGIASLIDTKKLLPGEPTGELIAVIGDDNNDFISIGVSKEFTATRDGALFLGINEGNLDDNSGAFDITVEIDPNSNN